MATSARLEERLRSDEPTKDATASPSLPPFLPNLVEVIASTFALDAPKVVVSPTIPLAGIDETSGALLVNVAWLGGMLRRFEGKREVGLAVVAARLVREITKLAPEGSILRPAVTLAQGCLFA